jgi:light-regulated signal transduction histidine kinase (bacteriophytochrome)
MIRLNAELEQRVADRTILLTATVAELEAFSYSVSHDLRNPLRAVDGFALVLIEDYAESLDDTARDYLARIRKGTQRMGMLIDDLLKLSRLSRVEMEFSALNLSEMANEAISQLRQREPERNVVFNCQQGLTAVGDASLVQDVLVNILENAWKYTRRQAEAHIEFFLQPKSDPAGPDTFAIRDNGVGFEMRYADKLFTAFQRLHSMSDFEGTGIGLATVRRILVRHGGQIRAESEVGKGSTFSFSFAPRSK